MHNCCSSLRSSLATPPCALPVPCADRPTRTDSRAGRTDQGPCCAPTIRLCPCHLAHARASFARLLWYLAAPPRIPVARARLHANPVSTPSQSARSPVLPLEPDHTLSLPTAFLTYPDRPCSTPRLLGSPARLTCSAHLLDSPARLDSARLCARFTCSPRACHASCLLLSPAVPHLLGSPLLVSLRVLASPVIFSVLFPRLLVRLLVRLAWSITRRACHGASLGQVSRSRSALVYQEVLIGS